MVDHVLQFAAAQARAGLLVVDLCSGSAALALSIATELPGSRVIAVELSPDGRGLGPAEHRGPRRPGRRRGQLDRAAGRGRNPGCRGRRGPRRTCADRSTWSSPTPRTCPSDAIPREPEVRDHDPDLALYGGPDGLEVVRPLAEQAALLLRPGGLLLVEHADVQGEDAGESGVPAVLRAQRDLAPSADPAWTHVTDHLDLAGRPRHTAAIRAAGRMAP